MDYVFFIEESGHTETKTAFLIPGRGEGPVYILKPCLQPSQVFADLSLQTDINIVITRIIPAEIKITEGFDIPFLIARFIPVFPVQGNIVQRSFSRIIVTMQVLQRDPG